MKMPTLSFPLLCRCFAEVLFAMVLLGAASPFLVVAAQAAIPTITTQPLSQPVFVGATANFVAVTNGGTTYQWQKGGINVSGATNSSLSVPNVQLTDAGSYALVVTNVDGSVTSRFARLVVLVAQANAITYGNTVISTGVTAGGVVNLSYFMTNVGTRTWGAQHYLSIRDINDVFAAFSPLIGVMPGESTTANLKFTAPTTPGNYTYRVQALENGIEFFSTATTIQLNVLPSQNNSITYNTTTFPVSAAPGSTMNFSYNVTNIGTNTWGAPHFLSLKDNSGTYLTFIPLAGMTPGKSKTVNFTFTAPTAPGTYTYTVQALEDTVAFFSTQANLTLVVLAPQPNAIVYEQTKYPDAVMPGDTVNLRYLLRNSGTQAWSTSHYISLRDSNSVYMSFLPLDGVVPGKTSAVSFSFTAPTTPGIYTYYVQALENGVEFFDTQNVVILTVLTTLRANAAAYNATTFPSTVIRGSTVDFTYTVTNQGTKTWGATYYLSFRDTDDNFLGFVSLSGLAPGASRTVNLSFPAPSTPGTYLYYAQVFESGVEFFPSQETLVLTVEAAALDAELSRFLIQASFGPSGTSLAQLRTTTYEGWIDQQMAMTPTYHLPYFKTRVAELMARSAGSNNGGSAPRQEAWWQNALTAPDQLRQRMAFALSEILVISQNGALSNEYLGATAYYDLLVKNAFGNYRALLWDVTLSPMMGSYLSMIRNQKPNTKTGSQPDENYAREIMQLFTIGLSELNPDGTLKLDANGDSIPTYTQADIVGLAHVFTGWGPHVDPANPPKNSDGTYQTMSNWFRYGWDPVGEMTFNTAFGDLQDRMIVRGVTVNSTLNGPQRLALALDTLFNHPNVGPFIARQLIQRFVTSNPSPAYVRRVAAAFNANAAGFRGDLGYTLRAVLLDPEARGTEALTSTTFGQLTEPVLRMSRVFRAYPFTPQPYAAAGDKRLFLNFINNMAEQSPLFAPTVFNFFSPGYSKSGAIANANLDSPEFQIYDDVVAMQEANRHYGYIYSGVSVGEPSGSSTNMKLDLSEPVAILSTTGRTNAESQAELVEHYNQRLLGGTMSPFLRQKILDTYASMPSSYTYSAANQLRRAQVGLYLVMFSPEFNIHR